MSNSDEAYRRTARRLYPDFEVEDDADVSTAPDGAFVAACVWVSDDAGGTADSRSLTFTKSPKTLLYAIIFALDSEALRVNHPALPPWQEASVEIGRLLTDGGFVRQQGNVWFGGERINAVTCVRTAQRLARELPWFAASVRDFRMLRIEDADDLRPAIGYSALPRGHSDTEAELSGGDPKTMTRREVLDCVRAQLVAVQNPEEAEAYAQWSREELSAVALRADLRRIANDPGKTDEIRAAAQGAVDLLRQRFGFSKLFDY